MENFQEKMVVKLLTENIAYEVAGWDNMVMDGDWTQKEFDENTTFDQMLLLATDILNESYKIGYLESPENSSMMEAKHIKFLGNEKIDTLKKVSIEKALKSF